MVESVKAHRCSRWKLLSISAFFANAKNPYDLSGPFDTYSVNIGFGPYQFSGQFSTDGTHYIASFSPPFLGSTYGASVSGYQTNTKTTGPHLTQPQ